MASLQETKSSGLIETSRTSAKKRKHTSNEEKATPKENIPVPPNVPARTKRQKLSKAPVKPPKYVNPLVASLQKKIEQEYSIRDGGSKLLQASKSNRQSMEVSKGLFVSDAKIMGHMRELQRQQSSQGIQTIQSSDGLLPCESKIAVSEIRIPLEWRDFEHSKRKLDPHPHGVFCLFRIGNQVMDTPSLVEVDRSTMDIVFKDTVIFPEPVGPDFNLEIEVYCSLPPDDTPSRSSTPIKMLKKLRYKDKLEVESPAAGPIHPSPYTPHALNITPTHRFGLAGYAQLTIKDVSTSCRTYALKRGMVGANGTASTGGTEDSLLLPLWGQICCCLLAEPECATQLRTAGFVNIQRMVGGLPDWKRYWCVVRQNHLRCWSSPEDVGKRMPIDTIDLTESMIVEAAPRLSMRRPNALLLKDNLSSSELFMAFESKEERSQWMNVLNQGILDLKVWKSSCEVTIPVPHSKFYTKSADELKPLPYSTTSSSLAASETIL